MKLNKIFTSHMVFPHNLPIRIYGEGTETVKIEFAGMVKTADSIDHKWIVEFPPMEYGGPYTMTVIEGKEKVVLEDIYVGEVYLFAGQSNMQFKMKASNTPPEMYQSNNMLRLYSPDRIEKTDYYSPDHGWVLCEKEFVTEWSALAYLAGNRIQENKNVAIGIIVCYQGASIIESWVPRGSFDNINVQAPIKHKEHIFKEHGAWNGNGTLYAYAISQVIPYSLSAVVWYQGESDASPEEGLIYAEELCVLIDIWRKDFQNEKLPFVIVQIADYLPRADEGWRRIQEAQLEVQSMRPFVQTVISSDVCENDDIHPKTKHKLAARISVMLETLS
jgi:sialate O-acetylesterase